MKKTIIFDMDMTLINSRPGLRVALQKFFGEYGVDCMNIDFSPLIGKNEKYLIAYFCTLAHLPYEEEMITRVFDEFARVAPLYVAPFDGAKELLVRLKKEGYTLALGTSTMMKKVEANFANAGFGLECFEAFLCGEDVQEAKPSPELFLKLAEGLGVSPKDCIVIEDAIHGITAAKAAGMACICVEYSFPKATLLMGGADVVVPTIDKVYDAIVQMG